METFKKKDKYFICLLVLLGIFIQQSFVKAGFNISISDLIIIIVFVYHIVLGNFNRNVNKIIYFGIMLYAYRLIVTVFIIFDQNLDFTSKELFSTSIKMAIVFIYTIMAYTIFQRKEYIKYFLYSYLISSTIIGLLCIIGTIKNIQLIKQYLFFDDIRAMGLMNDPNYFAVTQIITLILLLNLCRNTLICYSMSAIVTLSIISSGSKTATMIMLFLFVIYVCIKFLKGRIIFIMTTLSLLLIVLSYIFIHNNIGHIGLKMNINFIPSLERGLTVFSQGVTSLEDNGSNRLGVWSNALFLIKYSTLLGLGLADYVHVSKTLTGIDLVAHNTYLQIVAEWGIFFAIFLIGYLIKMIYDLLRMKSRYENLYLVGMILCLFIYFMTISLNNSRFVAFIIGALISVVELKKIEDNGRVKHE